MAKRRANSEGSIRKRSDGRWEGRYTAGHDPETGKRITKNVLGKTQAEVKEKLRKALEETRELDVIRSDDYTVGEWVKTWFELYSKPNVRPNTAEYYRRLIDCHVIPYIGHIKLNKLTTRDIQKLYNDLKDHGRVREVQKAKNPGLSSSYVRGLHMMLHNCLELTSGLRKGELVALLWSNLDVERKTLSVSKQAVRAEGGEIKVTRPKTATSIRKISIPQEAVDLLVQEHDKHPDNPYMFPSPKTGGMWFPDSVVNLHAKILKDAGLEHIRFHDLRHTFATMALQNGIDVKTVSSMLGHYDARFTLSVYAHATNRMQEEAAEKMGSFMVQSM